MTGGPTADRNLQKKQAWQDFSRLETFCSLDPVLAVLGIFVLEILLFMKTMGYYFMPGPVLSSLFILKTAP